MEFHGVAESLSLYTLVFYQIPKIPQGWRDFLAGIQIHSSTKPIEKNKARKTIPLLHQKSRKLSPSNYNSVIKWFIFDDN